MPSMVTLVRRGFGAAHHHVNAFAFNPLQSDGRQPAQSVRHIGVGQRGDDLRRQHLQKVVGRARAVDGFVLAARAVGRHHDLLGVRSDFHMDIHAS